MKFSEEKILSHDYWTWTVIDFAVGNGEQVKFAARSPNCSLREFRIQLKQAFEKVKTAENEKNERKDSEKDYEPNFAFEPVPALVDVLIEEEEEIVLFTDRAFLYRYVPSTEELKERGTGEVKILEHKVTGKTRVLMRRKRIFIICCNHEITRQMSLKPLHKSDRAWTWSALNFSEGRLRQETMALKFKTPDQAQKFKAVFEEAQIKIGIQASTSVAPAIGFKTTTLSTPTHLMNCNPTTSDLKFESEERLKFGTSFAFTLFNTSSLISSPGNGINLKSLPTLAAATSTRPLNMASCSASVSASDNEYCERETDRVFKPIIPLLEKIQVRTAEAEEEEVVFCHWATLFHLVDEKWEKWLGEVKTLRNTSTGETR